jgi:polyisoprenoid-binding protein YceI
MKTILITIVLILSTISILNSQEKLPIDSSKSKLKWFGEYTFYFGGHEGYISFGEGYFIKTKDAITGGKFTIDMTSILCLDIENEESNNGLVDHLKDPDFFDVVNFPSANLVITKVVYEDPTHLKVYADLTIKGVTNPISFQAEIDFEKKQMMTRFKIDRMKWGISYNSDLKDSAISDAIGFEVKLNL